MRLTPGLSSSYLVWGLIGGAAYGVTRALFDFGVGGEAPDYAGTVVGGVLVGVVLAKLLTTSLASRGLRWLHDKLGHLIRELEDAKRR